MARGKSRWRRWLLELLLAATVLVLIHAWQTRDAPTGVAPDIQGILLDGQPVSLAALQGQPVLVHFWATWCPVCGLEQGVIDSIADDYAVITVAMDEASADEIRSYMRDKEVDYPVLHDPDYSISRQYVIRGVPTSYILDADGNIRFVETGYTTGIGLRLRLWWATL